MEKFKVGDKVKFTEIRTEANGIKIINNNYYTEGTVPSGFIKHGHLKLHNDYFVNFAEIKHIYVTEENTYYLVEYKDCNKNNVCLGFKEESLELVFQVIEIEGEFDVTVTEKTFSISDGEDIIEINKNQKEALIKQLKEIK